MMHHSLCSLGRSVHERSLRHYWKSLISTAGALAVATVQEIRTCDADEHEHDGGRIALLHGSAAEFFQVVPFQHVLPKS